MAHPSVKVDYISRVEGQSGVDLYISQDGELKDLKVRVFEPPRFFEAFMVGRKYSELMELAGRICGICSVSHQITALRAVEDALKVEVSEATRRLRKLLAMSAIISSHAFSIYFLTLPDYFGYPDLIEASKDHSALLKRGFNLKKIGNDLTELIGGRSVHPVTAVLGRFTNTISKGETVEIRQRLIEAKTDALDTVALLGQLDVPNFSRKCEHIALGLPDEYAINEGCLTSSEGLHAPQRDYRDYIEETQVPNSTGKHSKVKGRSSYLVGPLARLNLNFDKLSSDARHAALGAGFKAPSFNPFHSPLARAVEIVHCLDECVDLLETMPYKEEEKKIEVKPGNGFAITEAPRGINYHNYTFDRNGTVARADIVPPTCQNYKNIEMDLWKFVPQLLGQPEQEIAHRCEMLIRAYDPCISCSVHAIKIHM